PTQGTMPQVRDAGGSGSGSAEPVEPLRPGSHSGSGAFELLDDRASQGSGSAGGSGASALEFFIEKLQTYNEIQAEFGKGLVYGFAVDGFWGTVTGSVSLLEMWWGGVKTHWPALFIGPVNYAGQEGFKAGIRVGKAAAELAPLLRQAKAELLRLKNEFLALSPEDWGHVLNGNLDALEGKLSPTALLIVEISREELQQIADYAASEDAPKDAANLAGRVAGAIIYEVAEALLLNAAAAATKSAKAAKLLELAKRIPDGLPDSVKAALQRLWGKFDEIVDQGKLGGDDLASIIDQIREEYRRIGSTGTVGENSLRELGGVSQVYFRTSIGGRYIDQLVDGIAHEAKTGYASLTKDIQKQISKDVELMHDGMVDGVTWHFYKSPITGVGGPSGPLLDELQKNGITVIIHE
ncbi:MAG: hypothetical protein M3552_20010, partial [Planctomycetota bacterium]|nr:hypothetical protein [Planctomycetota bacterium]